MKDIYKMLEDVFSQMSTGELNNDVLPMISEIKLERRKKNKPIYEQELESLLRRIYEDGFHIVFYNNGDKITAPYSFDIHIE